MFLIFFAIQGIWCQEKKTICDIITKRPISGVFLADYEKNEMYITDDSGSIPIHQIPKKLRATHPKYESVEFTKNELYNNDTLFLTEPFRNKKYKKSNSRELKEVDIFEELNQLIAQQRAGESTQELNFLSYLQATKEGKKLEEMRSIFQVSYSPRNGFHSNYPNILAGEFKFDEKITFLNYHTQGWMSEMHPFSKTPKNLITAFPSQISTLNAAYFELKFKTIELNGWKQRLVELTRKVDGVRMQFHYQINGLEIIEVRLLDGKNNRREIMNISEESNGISDLSLVYHYIKNRPTFMQFSYTVNSDSNYITRGYWREMDTPKLGKISTIGNFKITDAYTQIAILPVPNIALMDSAFKTYTNDRFDFLNDQVYFSSNPMVQEGILKSFTSTKEWSAKRLDIYAAQRNYYKMNLGSDFDKFRFQHIPEHWLVIWPIQQMINQPKETWAGKASIWLEKGEIYRYFEDNAKQALIYNLIFDYYEADRQQAMKMARSTSEKIIVADLNTAYAKTLNEVRFMLNEIDLSFKQYQAMYRMNQRIKEELKLDNFMILFNQSNQYSTNSLNQMDFISALSKAANDKIHTVDVKIRAGMLNEVIELYQRAIQVLIENRSTNFELLDSVLKLLNKAYNDANRSNEFCMYIQDSKTFLGEYYYKSSVLNYLCSEFYSPQKEMDKDKRWN
ncbi:MAG: hypothetical protein KJ941_10265 [Bacteroidetes bacterium]|nr:hypothetical protein [Bacteroidota bacterium]